MNKKLNNEEFINLENRIWKTYQSRIKAATRLNNYAKYLDFFSAYYTIFLAILSTFSLICPDSIIGYFTNAISIIVMGMVFYGNSMNFKDRHSNMRDNYLKLGDLYYMCINERIEERYNINSIYKEYSSLLNVSENHTSYDYLCHKMSRKSIENQDNSEINISKMECIKYYFRYWIEKLIILVALTIPIALFVVSIIEMFGF